MPYCGALDALDGGMWKWNIPSGQVELSPAWLRSIGYDPKDNPTSVEVCRQRVHPDDLPQVDRALEDHFQQRTVSYTSEYRLRTGDGRWMWVHDHGRVVARSNSGTAQVVSGAVFNSRPRYRADASAQECADAVYNSSRLKTLGAMAAGIAHEFCNQLAAILGDVQIARGQTETVPVRRSLDRIERVATQAAQVTRTLLTLSQGASLAMCPVRMDALIDETVDMLRALLPAQIRLRTETSNVQGMWIDADPVLLGQVLVNLALNARDAMPSGGALHIEAIYRPPNTNSYYFGPSGSVGRIVLSVGDNGLGMPEHVRSRVFEPYFSTKVNHSGTGLGLAIVKGIVEEHGGQVAVHSSPGHGTCVVIELPTCQPLLSDRRQL